MYLEIPDIERFTRDSPQQLASEIGNLARSIGFDHWMYGLDLPATNDTNSQYLLVGSPQEWVDHYFADEYSGLDPVIAHCQVHATPISWTAASFCMEGASTGGNVASHIFDEARVFGLNSGVMIPVHGLGCRWGFVSFATKTCIALDVLQQMIPDLHLLAHSIHDAGRRFASGTPVVTPHLTARETECLHWVAMGKTSSEVGCLLGVAARTVVFHLENAAHKFGVNGRQAAIAKAIAFGLVTP
jgi:DNA-binding CsgD family transcriptional regulator